jgi:hypothetical protein
MAMRTALAFAAAAGGAVLLLLLLDRALLRMEERGWIYYRRKRGHADRLGEAAFRVQSAFEPGKRYVLEEKERGRRESPRDGAPPDEEGS